MLTLAEVIARLEREPETRPVANGFGGGHSYRGNYSELAFSPTANTTVGAMLEAARACVDRRCSGYKGGTYLMRASTYVHLAVPGEAPEGSELTAERLEEMLAPTVASEPAGIIGPESVGFEADNLAVSYDVRADLLTINGVVLSASLVRDVCSTLRREPGTRFAVIAPPIAPKVPGFEQ